MFPDADDAPAGLAEVAVYFFVAGDIAKEFLAPEGAIVFGHGAVFGAAVPKAAINENGEALFGENEVGFAKQREPSTPTCKPMQSENLYQPQLGAFIAGTTHSRHNFGAL
jgi:hypothetical protein